VRDEIKGARILALDAATGKPQWEKPRQSRVAYCTPVVWDTPAGKQVAVAGFGRMIGYDLKTGAEKWFVAGMPAGPVASPVVADGTLFFAGWSPGGPDDKENQMPTFDALLKTADTNKDGALSREETQKTPLKDNFDTVDFNQDGTLTRDEWDMLLKFITDGKSSVFALSPGGRGDVTKTHLLWQKTKGLPYVPCAIVYRGQVVMVKDRGLVTAYDAKTGKELYLQERAAAPGRYYASPVAANGYIYFVSLEDGAVTVLKAGSPKPEVAARNPKLNERVAATPAIADNTLYIRTEKHLYAFAEKK
jgi:outer membrane protein assembly factor BamB